MSLKNQVALVTGASRGCGKGIALQLGQAGATVYVTSLRPEDEDDVVKSVQSKLPTLEDVAKEVLHSCFFICNKFIHAYV
jgi:dehydrogenase/reductase SDR family protein 1